MSRLVINLSDKTTKIEENPSYQPAPQVEMKTIDQIVDEKIEQKFTQMAQDGKV